jgi:hypothetical protein
MYIKANKSWIRPIAKLGLSAKGVVYCLTGLLAFMSAFQLGGHTTRDTTKQGIFQFIINQPAGKFVLATTTLGLLAYSIWRFIQALLDTEDQGDQLKGIAKRFTYFVSGLTYLSIFYFAFKFLTGDSTKGGDSRQQLIRSMLDQPAGQWLLGAVAILLAGIGVYQIWYGNSEKYRKHVNLRELKDEASTSLLRAGKIGYISRGVVWLILAFLFMRAAFNNNASQAGNTSSVFNFVEQSRFGPYLLAALDLKRSKLNLFSLTCIEH